MSRITPTATLALLTALALAPAVLASNAKPDNPGNGHGGARPSIGRARSTLVRPAGSVDDDARGRIDVATRPGDRADLRIKLQRLDADLAVDVTIEGADASEVVADGLVTDDDGAAHVMIRTGKGDTLPLGAQTLADLAGAQVLVTVAATGDSLLVGTVPAIGADLPNRFRGRSDLTNDAPADGGGSGRVLASFRGKDLRSELRIDVRGLTEGDTVAFLVADGDGTPTEVGTATADADGAAVYRVRTLHGDALPFEAATVLDLGGRTVRVDVNGSARLSGTVPAND